MVSVRCLAQQEQALQMWAQEGWQDRGAHADRLLCKADSPD
ncbi:MAG TPA: hypothetical protein VIK69_10600 [Methylophilaceae bacterium]